jgi:hypothetical protein
VELHYHIPASVDDERKNVIEYVSLSEGQSRSLDCNNCGQNTKSNTLNCVLLYEAIRIVLTCSRQFKID